MAFSRNLVDELLVLSARRCCLCREFKPLELQIHHIDQDGPDERDNAIVLCVRCHNAVHANDAGHAMGRKFTATELKKHRDSWLATVEAGRLANAEVGTYEASSWPKAKRTRPMAQTVRVKSDWVSTCDLDGNAVKEWHLVLENNSDRDILLNQPFVCPADLHRHPTLLSAQQWINRTPLPASQEGKVSVLHSSELHGECLTIRPPSAGISVRPGSTYEWRITFSVSNYFYAINNRRVHVGRHFYGAYEPVDQFAPSQSVRVVYRIAKGDIALSLDNSFDLLPTPNKRRETDKHYVFSYEGSFIRNRDYVVLLIVNLP